MKLTCLWIYLFVNVLTYSDGVLSVFKETQKKINYLFDPLGTATSSISSQHAGKMVHVVVMDFVLSWNRCTSTLIFARNTWMEYQLSGANCQFPSWFSNACHLLSICIKPVNSKYAVFLHWSFSLQLVQIFKYLF